MEYGIVQTQRNLIETIIEGHGIAGEKPSLPEGNELCIKCVYLYIVMLWLVFLKTVANFFCYLYTTAVG
jgi:hypothetical protein